MGTVGQHVGYVRVSSEGQNTGRQLEGLELDEKFEDRASGKDTNRPELEACLKHLRKGDTLHVHSMDRLARNLVDLLRLVSDLTSRGVALQFHKEKLTFTGESNPMQELQLAVMGAVAQFERSMIKERQREGIELAKAKGKHLGRPARLTEGQVKELVARAINGESKSMLADEYGITRAYVYRLKQKFELQAGGTLV